mgnify:CR=1 FL=1
MCCDLQIDLSRLHYVLSIKQLVIGCDLQIDLSRLHLHDQHLADRFVVICR